MQNCIVLCSLYNFLLKNVTVLFSGNQISKGHSFKGPFLTCLLRHKNSFSTYLTYIHARSLFTVLAFLPYQFCKNYEIIMYSFSLVKMLYIWFQIHQKSHSTVESLPGCSWVLQSRDSLISPRQLVVDGLPHDEQLLVRDCRPPHAVTEQVPHDPQDDHTK